MERHSPPEHLPSSEETLSCTEFSSHTKKGAVFQLVAPDGPRDEFAYGRKSDLPVCAGGPLPPPETPVRQDAWCVIA